MSKKIKRPNEIPQTKVRCSNCNKLETKKRRLSHCVRARCEDLICSQGCMWNHLKVKDHDGRFKGFNPQTYKGRGSIRHKKGVPINE